MWEPERISLANLPTPLVKLERLGRELGGANIWMKRDDLTGVEVSGNKVRKLEYVAADALAGGCDTLVTEGTPQSNHCRATAAVCARLGLQAVLLFRPEPPDGPPQGNHLLDTLFGAEMRSYPRAVYANRREQIIAETLAQLAAASRKPRWTPAGASEPLGCWGYMRAATELAEQLDAAGIGECDVVVAVSSEATYAGLVLGHLLHGRAAWQLWGVPVSDHVAHHVTATAELCRNTIEKYDLPLDFDEQDLSFVDGYVGEGYAIPYQAAIDALQFLARTEAIVLDPVYTAKAFCALLDGVRSRRWGVDRPAVFIHTGGAFSDFAWPELLAPPAPDSRP